MTESTRDANTEEVTPIAIPDDIEALKGLDTFKREYDKHTSNELRQELDDADVAYYSSDDKSDLTWRYMDVMGLPIKNDVDTMVALDATPSDDSQSELEQEAEAEVDQIIPDPEALVDATPASEPETSLKVNNSGPFSVMETASMTLLRARQVTEVVFTRRASREKITRNIEQMNASRGNTLKILD